MIQRTWYFRWWTYRKHIKQTPDGFIITEFLPAVPWGGKHNSISCPAGHHIYEGRWLKDAKYIRDYAKFWFRGGGSPRTYSFWAADAVYKYYEATGDSELVKELFPDLIRNYAEWEKSNLDAIGLFWQNDGHDGMEVSICGTPNTAGYRSTINTYMYADALAISKIAVLLGDVTTQELFAAKAKKIRNIVQQKLWDGNSRFFKVLPRGQSNLCDAKELHGYTPWYANLPDETKSDAWQYLMDTSYFFAPSGPTTAERNHPGFTISYKGHECQWNGPSWPYATSITLAAAANLLNNYHQSYFTKADYLKLLTTYSNSHQRVDESGNSLPWIDENLNPFTGEWISRTRLKTWKDGTWSAEKGGEERGKDYNHSSFCDLIITGLVGIRPQEGNELVVNPLVPDNSWSYFCLDNLYYHGKKITVLYDQTGKRYRKGKGLIVFVDGKRKAVDSGLARLVVPF